MSENQPENQTSAADLSWLADVQPVKTEMRTSKRGRQPGKNPVQKHIDAAYASGETLSLPVPKVDTRATERMLRRAAKDKSISVQVLRAHPDSATSDDVVALNSLSEEEIFAELPDDLWVLFSVKDKEDKPAASGEASENGSGDAGTDPFAGTPAAPVASEDEKPARRPGKKSTVRA